MQVIFLQNIKNVARKGDLKNVKDGYYFNFLLPKKLAIIATPAKIKETESLQKKQTMEKEKVMEHAAEVIKKLKNLKITMKAKAHGDKLYGSITEKEVAEAIAQETNVELDTKYLKLSEHIKVAGTYEIPVHLTEDHKTTITLVIKGEK